MEGLNADLRGLVRFGGRACHWGRHKKPARTADSGSVPHLQKLSRRSVVPAHTKNIEDFTQYPLEQILVGNPGVPVSTFISGGEYLIGWKSFQGDIG